MTGILVKNGTFWHCYRGSLDSKNWLCNMPTKKAAMEVGRKHGCTTFVVEKGRGY